jgi:hypothetical protein
MKASGVRLNSVSSAAVLVAWFLHQPHNNCVSAALQAVQIVRQPVTAGCHDM